MANAWTQFQPWQSQPLPPGWEARYDANVRRYYFIDHSTHKTTWQDPRAKKPEAIPLSQFKTSSNTGGSSQLETSFGGTSSQPRSQSRQPAALKPAEPQQPASFGSEDDFPIDSFLASMLKEEKSEEDKQNVKKKLIREFPDVDDVVIDVSLRTAKYEESRAREIIKKLKGDDDKQRAQAKKQEPSKAKGKAPAVSSVEELNKTKAKAAAAAKAKSSSQELHAKATPGGGGGGLAAAAAAAAATAKAKSSSQELHVKATPTAVPKTVKSTSPAPPKTTAQKKAAATQSKQAQRKMVSVASKTYRSPLLSVPSGPNPANAQGANALNLLPEWVQPEGPQRQNRAGPQRGIRRGPARRATTRKVPLNCGAQASNHKGPNINLVVGSMYSTVSHI